MSVRVFNLAIWLCSTPWSGNNNEENIQALHYWPCLVKSNCDCHEFQPWRAIFQICMPNWFIRTPQNVNNLMTGYHNHAIQWLLTGVEVIPSGDSHMHVSQGCAGPLAISVSLLHEIWNAWHLLYTYLHIVILKRIFGVRSIILGAP